MTPPVIDELLASGEQLPLVVVHGPADALPDAGARPVIVCHVGDALGSPGPPGADLVVGPGDLDALVAQVARTPIAATTLAVHLRTVPTGSVEHGLAVESAVYSTLQAGDEFADWRASADLPGLHDDRPTIETTRDGRVLHVRLHRPHRHNAITARLRDELHAALTGALTDSSVEHVVLSGDGPSFSSGGDLAEFGTRPDPATAHRIRILRSPARRIHQLSHRIEVNIHGVAFGGGIEMAAFAPRIVAHPDTRIALPEVALGLIPGAGGTVSMTRRIGAPRVAALALTGQEIDAPTALHWGLIDEIERPSRRRPLPQ